MLSGDSLSKFKAILGWRGLGSEGACAAGRARRWENSWHPDSTKMNEDRDSSVLRNRCLVTEETEICARNVFQHKGE